MQQRLEEENRRQYAYINDEHSQNYRSSETVNMLKQYQRESALYENER